MLSPDLFLAASSAADIAAGRYQLIVGELHYGAQVWCHFLTFCDEQGALATALEELFSSTTENGLRAGFIHRRQQGKTFYLELPGVSVEMLGRSTKPHDRVLPVSDLEVVQTSAGLALCSRSRQQRLEVYPGDPRSVVNWLFGTPPVIAPSIRFGAHTPRIEIGGAVFQRARWELKSADFLAQLADLREAALLMQAQRLRLNHGLPERCFVRVPQERKPFYLDFANLLSLEFFLAMIRDESQVELTEFLPTADQWWLRRPDGVHSCEWRMTLVYKDQGSHDASLQSTDRAR
jgi:hypothetical protein